MMMYYIYIFIYLVVYVMLMHVVLKVFSLYHESISKKY